MARGVLLLMTPLALIGSPMTVDAGPRGSARAPMYVDQGWTCTAGDVAASDAHGFVVVNMTAKGTLLGTVSLKGVEPNSTYDMWITDGSTLGPCPASPHIGTMSTNADGNGTFHFSLSSVGAAPQLWVIAEGAHDVRDRYQSPAVDLG